jgi:hypothetical protein
MATAKTVETEKRGTRYESLNRNVRGGQFVDQSYFWFFRVYCERIFTTDKARQSCNQKSEYLAQRRKGRKEIKLPNLAFLASLRRCSGQAWREQIPVLDSHGPPENLRQLRKPSSNTEFAEGLFKMKTLFLGWIVGLSGA